MGVDVVAEHPEGRPHAGPRRDADTRLDASVLKAPQPSGEQPRRGPVTRGIATRQDVQIAITSHEGVGLLRGVAGRLRGLRTAVGLEFPVAPPAVAGLVNPVGGVSIAARSVELVRPGQMLGSDSLRRRGRGVSEGKAKQGHRKCSKAAS